MQAIDAHSESDRRRTEVPLVFDDTLENLVGARSSQIIITGPKSSGKSTMARAAMAVGVIAAGAEGARQIGSLDFALAGEADLDSYQDSLPDEIVYRLGDFESKFKTLPPIVMVDEVLPEHKGHIPLLYDGLNKYYQDHGQKQPQILWIFQEEIRPDSPETSETLSGISTSHAVYKALLQATVIELAVKEGISSANNSAFVAAASDTARLRKSLGEERFTKLVNIVRDRKVSE